jgi:hypothetical protein
MIYVADWQDPCWRYRLGCCASDTMSGSFHVSFGCCWTGVKILFDQFLAQVGASVEEALPHRLE